MVLIEYKKYRNIIYTFLVKVLRVGMIKNKSKHFFSPQTFVGNFYSQFAPRGSEKLLKTQKHRSEVSINFNFRSITEKTFFDLW